MPRRLRPPGVCQREDRQERERRCSEEPPLGPRDAAGGGRREPGADRVAGGARRRRRHAGGAREAAAARGAGARGRARPLHLEHRQSGGRAGRGALQNGAAAGHRVQERAVPAGPGLGPRPAVGRPAGALWRGRGRQEAARAAVPPARGAERQQLLWSLRTDLCACRVPVRGRQGRPRVEEEEDQGQSFVRASHERRQGSGRTAGGDA
mmetsp:Transcript_100831/g.268049  ORF Transcript_100831/g.268049 Transcript_100831/m.268049 type:complete len:208 (-) Transcript_100831:239-862(-)